MSIFTKEKTRKTHRNIIGFYNLRFNDRGFSLIEITIVIIIMGILTAVAVPLFTGDNSNAKRTVCLSNLYDLRTAEEAYNMLHGTHSDEYLNETELSDESGVLEFFDSDFTVTCPSTGEYYYWGTRDGVKMLFCPEHGTVHPPVIDDPPPVPVTITMFMEMAQAYAEDRITRLEFSEKLQKMSMDNDLVYGTDEIDIIQGKAGDDLIDGGGGDDNIQGNNNNDGIFGGDGNDYINGGNGNDILVGGNGNDHIIGAAGNDTVVYDKSRGSYTITKVNNNKFLITDNDSGDVDTVESVEYFQFGEDEIAGVAIFR